MARQRVHLQGPRAIGPALFGLAFVFAVDLPGRLADMLCHLQCALLGAFLEALPGILLAGLQTLESCALAYGQVLDCVQWLLSAGPLLRFVAGAL